MRAQSPKRRRELPARRQLTAHLIELAGGRCKAQTPVCTGRAVCLHERRKRSSNGDTLLAANCVPICVACNQFIEDEPAKARVMRATDGRTLVVREGDPDWSHLGRNRRAAETGREQ